jgi:hypothetical protein
MKRLIDKVISDYRQTGFPHYRLPLEEKRRQYRALLEYPHDHLISEDIVRQTMHGLGLAWSYFPHAVTVRCKRMRTSFEAFNDPDIFRSAIEKTLQYSGAVTASSIRKALRYVRGTQSVSNFRPSAAAAIYHEFLPEQGGVVYDPSGGFGGRLLGAFACHRVRRYIACEPAKATFLGLERMAEELSTIIDPDRQLQVDLQPQIGSEDFKPNANSIDLIIGSPPFYRNELYSTEATQSYRKFPSKREWLTGFVGATLANCAHALKSAGVLAINVANTHEYPNLEQEFLELAEREGWRLIRTLRLALSKMIGTKGKTTSKFKYEPIFIFIKQAHPFDSLLHTNGVTGP